MKKQKAIKLLQLQIDNINHSGINRKEWITTTLAVIQRVFPVSSSHKVAQIQNLEDNPEYFQDLSPEKRINTRKSKAATYLQNYIEEIELLGMESYGDKIEMIFGSFRFWAILSTICILSFIGGNSAAVSDPDYRQSGSKVYEHLEKKLDLQKKQIDSLREELQIVKSRG